MDSMGTIMNIKQLTYFSKIYELRNMTHAAETLHIAQPALSQQIAALEQELNTTLFIREKKGVYPTKQGDILYRQAQSILRHLAATKALLLNNPKVDETISGKVSIGLASSTSSMLSIPLIQEVRKELPGIILELVSITSNDLPSLLGNGRVDFILAPDPHKTPSITIKNLLIEELFLLVAKELFTKDNESVSIQEISSIPLILPSAPNKLRSRIDHAFLIEQMSYDLIAESGHISVLIPAVVAGLAGTILPYSSAYQEINTHTIQAYTFEKKMFREIAICYSNNIPLSYAVTSVMDLCIKLTNSMIEQGKWKYCEFVYKEG